MTDFLCLHAGDLRGPGAPVRLRGLRSRGLRSRRLQKARTGSSDGPASGAPRAAGIGAEDLAGGPGQRAPAGHVHPTGAAGDQGERRRLRRGGGSRRLRSGSLSAPIRRCRARRPPAADHLAPHQPDEEGQESEVEQPDERQAAGLPSSPAAVIGRRPCRSRSRQRPRHGDVAGRRRAAPPRADPARAPATGRRPDRPRRPD